MRAEGMWAPPEQPQVLPALAMKEAWRFVRHPLTLVGLTLWVLRVADDGWDGPRPAFSALTSEMTIYWGIPLFFAAHLVATSARRAEELFAAVPSDQARRTAALCLAALGPFALSCAALAVLVGLYEVTGNELERFPTLGELAAGPVNMLAGCLLAVAVARWLPWRGAPVLVMLGLIAVNMFLIDTRDWYMFSIYLEFALWGPSPYLDAVGFIPVHGGPHALYLLSLGLGAGALAMLKDGSRPGIWLASGVAAVVSAVMTGMAQLW
ncbi:hypothetical protein OUY22_03110 [Nonomuraea sp. MCN248]|uniref:ABC transporter permease n=1 Tax=Nonomuraea corallina TaxID=2989783 RepID=A0ABT4S5E0_9ACTN|nr:hypothetical protein [Nonomuraea corallina]MDA0632391.1 hypothetical protein [Nonomuraea corallina]